MSCSDLHKCSCPYFLFSELAFCLCLCSTLKSTTGYTSPSSPAVHIFFLLLFVLFCAIFCVVLIASAKSPDHDWTQAGMMRKMNT